MNDRQDSLIIPWALEHPGRWTRRINVLNAGDSVRKLVNMLREAGAQRWEVDIVDPVTIRFKITKMRES